MSGKTATPTGSALTDTEFFAPLVSAWQPQDDQSTHAAYTASDLMTAEGSATTGEDNTLHLSFTMNHRMALAVIEMPNTVKYKFTDERIPDYAVSPATTFSGIAQPLRVNDGTYRYLVNHATPAPTIEGRYDEGSKEFTITPSGLSTGSYKRYKVDGAVTTVKDYTMQRGDYLLADGNLLPKGTTLTEEQKAEPFAQGVEMTYKQLMTTLESIEVKPIEAVGKEFDPNLHNAVMHVEDENLGENVVAEEFQKGYTYRDSVIRHSMVKVAN